MEAYSGNFGIALSKIQSQRNTFVHGKGHPSSVDDGDLSVKHTDKPLKVKRAHSIDEDKSNSSG